MATAAEANVAAEVVGSHAEGMATRARAGQAEGRASKADAMSVARVQTLEAEPHAMSGARVQPLEAEPHAMSGARVQPLEEGRRHERRESAAA